MWYLRGFLPSGSAKCCKLQHFVRCLCSSFKRAVLSHVLCILPQETTLQIETGQQRDPKESWREGRTDAFTHTGKVLHRSLYSKELLHTNVLELSDTKTVTQRSLTQRAFTHGSFHTQRNLYTTALSHRGAFTHRRKLFAQRSLYTLHRETFTHKSFYTEKSLHRGAFTRSSKLKLALSGNHLLPKKPSISNTYVPKDLRNILLKQVLNSFEVHTAMKWRVE